MIDLSDFMQYFFFGWIFALFPFGYFYGSFSSLLENKYKEVFEKFTKGHMGRGYGVIMGFISIITNRLLFVVLFRPNKLPEDKEIRKTAMLSRIFFFVWLICFVLFFYTVLSSFIPKEIL